MPSAKKFERDLDDLFRRYTEGLRREAGRARPGPVPKMTAPRVRKDIDRLVATAADIELKLNGRSGFRAAHSEKHQWHAKRGKGWGLEAKKRAFRQWYDNVVHGRNCVYIFWSGRRCIYVGRTGAGGRRPQAHFEKYWFRSVSRVDVYIIQGKRQLPAAECLAIHLYKPTKNKVKSAQQKWRSPCPVCSKEVQIRKGLKMLFPLRRPRKR